MRSLRFLFIAGLTFAPCAACHFGFDGPLLDFGRDCATSADCADYEPPFALFYSRACNETFCDAGRCDARPREGRIADDNPGDCLRPVCRNGSRTLVADDTDSPTRAECSESSCSGGWSTTRLASDGTQCSWGQCLRGACVAVTPDAGGDASDGASDDASDAGAD